MFLIREARLQDWRQILPLARILDSINLPTTPNAMREALRRSQASFRGRIRDRTRALYIFCAEEPETRKTVGASMIIAKHGTPLSPHYYLQISHDERYSHTLRKMFRHTYLRLNHSMDGPTEVGGLIVDPALRGHPEKLGLQLSWIRFLYIGKYPRRFEPRIIAEIMPPQIGNHGNLFWDHYGRRVTGLTFREADRLSSRDKEFIRALFPEAPLYTFLLPEPVREYLGAVAEQSRPAVRLLERAGLHFLDQIDPFDAGPYYGGIISELPAVQTVSSYRVAAGPAGSSADQRYLVARQDRAGFRAVCVGTSPPDGPRLILEPQAIHLLGIKEGAQVDALALP